MKYALVLLVFCCSQILATRVVINEVCYDPEGADGTKEWIELFNAGSSEVNLYGSRIYSGGSSYTLDYVFPHFILRPGRFVLVGGDAVANTHLSCNFSFQNGGSASDAIRYVSADSLYSDTVIYDEPNSNALIDDSGIAGISFAADVSQGYSLARICDGFDTDTCATDFYAEAKPTPGAPNRSYADYGITGAAFSILGHQQLLSFYICNYSVFSPPESALLTVWQEDQLWHEVQILPIPARDSIHIEILLQPLMQMVEISLTLPNDPNPENNYYLLSPYAIQIQAPLLNEVFAAPLPGKQEWLELYQEAVPRSSTDYVIRDASGNRSSFTLPALPGYYVLCNNALAFLQDYPSCPASKVIQSRGWANLNNNGDELYLYDEEELIPLDAMSYSAQQLQSGKSLERHLDQEQNVIWKISTHPDGASPANANLQNVLPPQDERLKIIGSPLSTQFGEKLSISYNLPDDPSRVNCQVFDLNGHSIKILASNTLVSARGNLYWDGRKQGGSPAPRGLYLLLWESQGASGGKTYRKQMTAVLK